MGETNEILSAIQAMERARVILEADTQLIAELRERIEQQRVLIAVALGYMQSGRPDRAAVVLSGKGGKGGK